MSELHYFLAFFVLCYALGLGAALGMILFLIVKPEAK